MNVLVMVFMVHILDVCNCQWIDPHDMNTRHKSKLKSSSSESDIIVAKSCISHEKEDQTYYYFYLKRLVSLIVQSSTLDKSDPTHYQGHILFNVNEENYKFLLDFVKNDQAELSSLRKLEVVLSDSLGKNLHDEYLEVVLSFHDRLYHAIFGQKTLWLIGALVMFWVVYQLFRTNFSLSYVFGYLFFLVLIADFCMRYLEMEEEARVHNANVIYSALCDTTKMNWYEFMKFITSSRDCEKKVVTPLTVFLFQVKSLIIVPLHALGNGIGGFGKEMFVTLPWGLNIVMWPMMMLCCVIMFIFFVGFIRDQTIEFNFCHLLKLKFGGRRDGFHATNVLTGRPLERLLEAVFARQAVQAGPIPIPEGVPDAVEEVPAVRSRNRPPLVNQTPNEQQELIDHPVPSNTQQKLMDTSVTNPAKDLKSLNLPKKEGSAKRHSHLNEEKFKEQTEEFCTNDVVECENSIVADVGGSGDHCPATLDVKENPNKSHFLDEIEKILEDPKS